MRDVQLDFVCRRCGLEGLTPEVGADEAQALMRGDLKLRCPACGALLLVPSSWANFGRALQTSSVSELLSSTIGEHIREHMERLEAEIQKKADAGEDADE